MSADTRMIEQLQMQIKESQQARQKAEQARQKAEQTRQKAEQTYQEIQRKLQILEHKARGLSWPEALSLWHTLYSNPKIHYRYTTVQPSDFTSAKDCRHPKELVHWENFHREHKPAFSFLCNQFAKPEARAFKSRSFYQDDAERVMSNCVLDDGVDLVNYEQRTVEELVINVWHQKGGDKIRFKGREDHSLDDITSRLNQRNTGKKTSAKETNFYGQKFLYDKVCYTIVGKDQRRDVLVIEYKSADKLTPAIVELGLHDMEIDKIKNRAKSSTDEGEKRKEKAEEAIAIVVTQTYDYMINQGLSYGYVNGGKSFIFLFVDPEKPDIVYYEKVILKDPFATSYIASNDDLRVTAVGLVAGFAQMALSMQPWDKTCRSKALNELPTWVVDEENIMSNMLPSPNSKTKSVPESLEFEEPEDHYSLPDTSPRQTRSRAKAKKDLARQKSETVLARSQKDDDDPSGTQGPIHLGVAKPGFIQAASKSGQNTTTESKRKRGASNTKGKNKAAATSLQAFGDDQANTAMPDRPYCTQACLLGLIRGRALDKKCPNVKAHQKGAQYYNQNTTNGTYKSRRQRYNRHAIDQPAFVRLIDDQLHRPERNSKGGFESLERSGWAGALFRIELLSHGYTFVGKGTVKPLVPVLEFEADMYKRMNTIQGKAIPVYLGSVNLNSAFYLTTRTAIVHPMLLSWAGEEGCQCGIEPERLWLETVRSHHEVAALGVQQGDLRDPNVLWNYELDRAILIDFEYAIIEEEQDKIESAIEKNNEAKKKIKVLRQKTSANRVSRQGEDSQEQPASHQRV